MEHVRLLSLGFALCIGMITAAPSCSSTDNASSGGAGTSSTSTGAGQGGAGQGGAGVGGTIFTGTGGGGQGGAGANCIPPDMLIVLDRTMSMHRRPDGTVPPDTAAGHAESKWFLAIQAVETLTKSLEKSIRFGLELFPKDPGMKQCVTLSERIQGITATNPTCQTGEVLVAPNLSTSLAIDAALDPEKTLLCTSTPIGAGLTTARDELAAIQQADRPQFVVLIGDGGDTCDQALPLTTVQELAKNGVASYVIGFDGSGDMNNGVNKPLLNDLACAGHTSPGFPANCIDDGKGNYAWDANSGVDVFLLAQDGAALQALLAKLGADVCCDCVPS